MKTSPSSRWQFDPFWGWLLVLAILCAGSLAMVDARSASLLRNTLLLAGSVCAISLPLGTLLAWLLVRTDLPWHRLGLALLGAMLFVPLYLVAAGWQAGFGLQGWYAIAFRTPALLQGFGAAIWIHSLAATAWVVLIVGIGFRLVEPEFEEQALLDGPPSRVFFSVTLPSAAPALGVAALWIAIVTSAEMTVTDLFAVRTYAEEIYTSYAVMPDPEGLPLSMLPGMSLIAGLAAASLLLAMRLAPHGRPLSLRPCRRFALGRWRVPLAVLVGLMLLALIGVPLANLCYKAGVVVLQTEAGRVRSWSAAKCVEIVASSPIRYQTEFTWSILLGVLSATTSVVIGAALGWFARRGRGRTAALLTLIAVLLAIPGPMVGLAVIRLLNRPELPLLANLYDRSVLAPWLAQTLRTLAPATLILWHALRTVPQELLDGASIDGAGRWSRFWHAGLASRRSALAVAWLVAFALALGELAATVLVVPPGMIPLSVRIFDLLHSGVQDQVAGICLAMMAGFAGIAGAIALLAGFRSGNRRSGQL